MQVLYLGQVTDLSAAIHSLLVERRDLARVIGSSLATEIGFGSWLGRSLPEIGFESQDSEWRYIDPSDRRKWAAIEQGIKIAAAAAYPYDGDDFVVEPEPAQINLDEVGPIIEAADWRTTPVREIHVIHKCQRRTLCDAINLDLNDEWDKWRDNLGGAYTLKNEVTGESHYLEYGASGELVRENVLSPASEGPGGRHFWLRNTLASMLFIADGKPHFMCQNATRSSEIRYAIIDEIRKALDAHGGSRPAEGYLYPPYLNNRVGPIIEDSELVPLSTLIEGEV